MVANATRNHLNGHYNIIQLHLIYAIQKERKITMHVLFSMSFCFFFFSFFVWKNSIFELSDCVLHGREGSKDLQNVGCLHYFCSRLFFSVVSCVCVCVFFSSSFVLNSADFPLCLTSSVHICVRFYFSLSSLLSKFHQHSKLEQWNFYRCITIKCALHRMDVKYKFFYFLEMCLGLLCLLRRRLRQ